MNDDFLRVDALDIPLGDEFDGLRVFAVGGAVRAQFTGNPVSDIDLMVSGVSPGEMVERGFELVVSGNTPEGMTNKEYHNLAVDAARDRVLDDLLSRTEGTVFPVFIDSHGREVALARMERSTGDGHNEFSVVANADVTVEEDLERRDLTVNAMAVSLTDTDQFAAGDLIDPFDGRQDISDERIRVVRPESFAEDPLRVLRMARFASRLEFDVEPETISSASDHVDGLRALPNDRLGAEVVKAMKQSPSPSRFFRVLDEVGALDIVFPELVALQGVPAGPSEYHQEGDAFEHTMLVVDEMASLRPGDERALLAAVAHDFGKALTPESELPSHPKHHVLGPDVIPDVRDRLNLPSDIAGNERHDSGGVMGTAARFHMRMHDIEELNDGTVIEMVDRLRNDYEVNNQGDDPSITHITLDELIDLAAADAAGRKPSSEYDRDAARERFARAKAVLNEVGGDHVLENFDPKNGEHIGELLHQERIKAFKNPEAFGISVPN